MVYDKGQSDLRISLVAGAVGGLISDACVHPVDTVKTRLWCSSSAASANSQVAFRYNNFSHALVSIVKNEGAKSLYKGFSSVALFTTVGHALYFGAYEFGKTLAGNYSHKNVHSSFIHSSFVHEFKLQFFHYSLCFAVFIFNCQEYSGEHSGMAAHLVAGCFANAVGGLAWTPMDVIKQRLQVQSKLLPGQVPSTLHHRGVFHGISAILKADGPRGLLRGYWASLGTFGPFSAVYFSVLEELKGAIKSHKGYSSDAELTVPQLMAVGALASACGAFVSGPMDLIKTRIQVYRTSNGGKFYGGTLDALKRTLTEEGYRAFTKGLGARVMWLAPGSAITIAVYDRLKATLNSSVGDL
jgi:hypothetical protein